MKGLSDTAWAVVSIISILLVALFTYLWAMLGSNLFAAAIAVPGLLFVAGVNRSAR